jgi:predicted methyltransferase
MGPVLTLQVSEALRTAARAGKPTIACTLDLGRSTTTVEVTEAGWRWQGRLYPHLQSCKDRTVYYWVYESFQPAMRYTTSLIKLVPTEWGAPTFEIDGIKMLPTARVSPYADAGRKVDLIQPGGKVILDTCGGLGYFAAWCLHRNARRVLSYEKNPDVIWLRGINPWSPQDGGGLTLTQADITVVIESLPGLSVDAVLHDPPRFGIAGELSSQAFYDHLGRVLKPNGRLFHYTGTPNKLTSGRDVPVEVAKRLRHAGFVTQFNGDGVLAVKKRGSGRAAASR